MDRNSAENAGKARKPGDETSEIKSFGVNRDTWGESGHGVNRTGIPLKMQEKSESQEMRLEFGIKSSGVNRDVWGESGHWVNRTGIPLKMQEKPKSQEMKLEFGNEVFWGESGQWVNRGMG